MFSCGQKIKIFSGIKMIATTSLHVGSHVCYGEKTWLHKVEYANLYGERYESTINRR